MEHTDKFEMESAGILPFDPIVLVKDVVKRWLEILTLALVAGMLAFVLTDAAYTPEYEASATLVVTTRSGTGTVYNNLITTSNLATVFSEVVNSSVFRKTVLAEGGITDFSGKITAQVVPDTNLLTVRATAADPKTAFRVMQVLLQDHHTVTEQVMGDVVVEVLQRPTVPTAPANGNMAMHRLEQMTLIALALGCLGVGYLSFRGDKVRSGNEARKKLECWYLGELPHERKKKTLKALFSRQKRSILITEPTTGFRFTEAIHRVRHRVEQRMGSKKVLMVTSLLENEGKSTVAINLALSMAKKNRKVLLMDCDLRKPACASVLNTKWSQPGVRAVLTGEAEAEDVIVYDYRNGLHILLERNATAKSADLLSSRRMAQVLEKLREMFDVIILDLPPMGVATDAEGLMDLADASLLVVRQNAAAAPAINKALASLNNAQSRMLGCVLNNVSSTAFFSGQGSGYGTAYGRQYRYGSYGKQGGGHHG